MDKSPRDVPKASIPQQPRSRQTRQRILDAAAELLTASGYEGFTTGVLSEQAGVSKGALFKHFPARETLVVATVEHIFERQRARFASAHDGIDGTSVREGVRAALHALLSVLREPEYLAVLQVYGAARTNPRLASALRPITEVAAAKTNLAGGMMLTAIGVPADAQLSGLVTVLFYTLEGIAQDEMLSGESAASHNSEALLHLERLIVDLIPERGEP